MSACKLEDRSNSKKRKSSDAIDERRINDKKFKEVNDPQFGHLIDLVDDSEDETEHSSNLDSFDAVEISKINSKKLMNEQKMTDKTYEKSTENSETYIENGAISVVENETSLKNDELSVENLGKNNEQWIENDQKYENFVDKCEIEIEKLDEKQFQFKCNSKILNHKAKKSIHSAVTANEIESKVKESNESTNAKKSINFSLPELSDMTKSISATKPVFGLHEFATINSEDFVKELGMIYGSMNESLSKLSRDFQRFGKLIVFFAEALRSEKISDRNRTNDERNLSKNEKTSLKNKFNSPRNETNSTQTKTNSSRNETTLLTKETNSSQIKTNSSQNQTNSSSNGLNSSQYEQKISTEIQNVECQICQKKIIRNKLREHLLNNHRVQQFRFKCSAISCSFWSPTLFGCRLHIIRKHQNSAVKVHEIPLLNPLPNKTR